MTPNTASTLRVFDPAMCCSTGVCGPSIDPALARFSADLDWLKGQGVVVERYNLAQQPGAFVAHAAVQEALAARGNDCLPLILVGDRIAAEGTYPSRETLAALAGVVVRNADAAQDQAAQDRATKSAGCCGPSESSKSGCC